MRCIPSSRTISIFICLIFLTQIFAVASYAQQIGSSYFLGTWDGEIYQPNTSQHYHGNLIINSLASGSVVGTSYYSTLHCGGTLTFESVTNTQLRLYERITYGPCVTGRVVLDLVGKNNLNFNWYYPNGGQALYNQNLTRSGAIICGNPELRGTFSSVHPLYHTYPLETAICTTNVKGCNKTNVFNLMTSALKYDAPALPFNTCKPVVNCGVYNLEYVLSPNPITVTLDAANQTAINYTMPGHLFHPGTIKRKVIERSGQVLVQTTGEGEGSEGLFNEIFGPILFNSIDQTMRTAFITGGSCR